MAAVPAGSARRSRWALSFADLLLLLLGFFVMLQASGSRRDAMLAQVSARFGGRPAARATELQVSGLFLPDEALLTAAGRHRLSTLARQVGPRQAVELRSSGVAATRRRFDEWDLAAARLGAVARALQSEGVAQDRLTIRGLDEAQRGPREGQTITLSITG